MLKKSAPPFDGLRASGADKATAILFPLMVSLSAPTSRWSNHSQKRFSPLRQMTYNLHHA